MSPEFENILHSVISGSCEGKTNEHRINYYMPIIRLFGTHYTTEVTMGAKATQRRILSKKAANSIKEQSKTYGVSISASVGYKPLGISAESGGEYKSRADKHLRESITSETKEVKEFYIGGSAPDKDFENSETKTTTTESLREWARSAQENPAPIEYRIESIAELIKTDQVFRKPIKGNIL